MTATQPQAFRQVFADLAARLQLSELDQRLIDAFDRLASGQSAVTDGALTVTNLCLEAEISRASYYRSPVAGAVKDILASGQLVRPEVDQLRERVKELRRADAMLRREHAAEIRDLKATVATYANQIQALTLRNAELEATNARLRDAPGTTGEIIPLRRPEVDPGGARSWPDLHR